MQAKKGIHFSKAKSIVNEHSRSNWSLVIGAGTSHPIFPSWPDLIRKMFAEVYSSSDTDEINNMISHFPLDSVLQSLKNYSHLNDEDFGNKLSNALYATLWNSLTESERLDVFSVLANPIPGSLTDKVWQSFYAIMKDNYRHETFYALADTLLQAHRKGVRPFSIMSFNAESILHAVFASMIREYYGKKRNRRDERLKQKLDIVTRSISYLSSERIPFYHVHGHLPVPHVKSKGVKRFEALDKLVFSENEYLNLANSNFSWQSSVFLHSAYTSTLIFVGLSFGDHNLRKWLSWTHSNRLREIKQFNPNIEAEKAPSQHYWIKKKPKSSIEESLLENNVAHLGVRIIWIDEYKQSGDALAALIGI